MLSKRYKISGIVFLVFSTLSGAAQVVSSQTIEIDTLTKILGITVTIGGFYMGYTQMKMAQKLAILEAKFNKTIADVKEDFANKIDRETEKLEGKIEISSKNIEARMASRHDIDNLKTIIKLTGDVTSEKMDGLKNQLDQAADLYKKDKG